MPSMYDINKKTKQGLIIMEDKIFTKPAMMLYCDRIMAKRSYKLMGLEERGLLLSIFCESWTNGKMPVDIKEIALLLNKPELVINDAFTDNLKSFLTFYGEDFTVDMVEYYREELQRKSAQNVENGRKGGVKAHSNSASKPKGKPAEKDLIPYQAIVDLFNEILVSNPSVQTLTEARKVLIRGRWNDTTKTVGSRHTLEYWEKVFRYMNDSDFLTGKVKPNDSKKPFLATFDWIFNVNNYAKIVEGNYVNED